MTFPNATTIAYFDPQSQAIQLNEISFKAFLDAVAREDLVALRENVGTIFHEVTHWADTVGTVWGQSYLSAVYRGLKLLERKDVPGAENDYHQFVTLHDLTRRIQLSDYYRVVHAGANPHDVNHRWIIQFSAGREFDTHGRIDNERPILFTRFLDHDSQEQIIRQPMAIGALLEINAVWSEIVSNREILSAMSADDRLIEEAIHRRERLSTLYSEEMTIYTAPVHMLAHYARITDVTTAYEFASAVSHLVLNLSVTDFASLRLPPTMRAWAALFPAFKRSANRGFAFGVICAHSRHWTLGTDVREWLDDALARAGLRPAHKIHQSAQCVMERRRATSGTGLLDEAERYLGEIGATVFRARSAGDTSYILRRSQDEDLPVPPLIDMNGDLLSIRPDLFDVERFPLEEIGRRAASLHTWTMNLLSSCR
ncbi:MAG: hypothetical protein ACRYGP_07955 [Janthinobacterium lividum]